MAVQLLLSPYHLAQEQKLGILTVLDVSNGWCPPRFAPKAGGGSKRSINEAIRGK